MGKRIRPGRSTRSFATPTSLDCCGAAFVGPCGVITGLAEASDDARLVLVWEVLPLPVASLSPWLAARATKTGNPIFVLHHAVAPSPAPGDTQRAVKEMARDRSIEWIEYSHVRSDPAYRGLVAVLKSFRSVGPSVDYHAACGRLIRTLVAPRLEDAVDRLLASLLEWDLELQLQLEHQDGRNAYLAQGDCTKAFARLGTELANFTGNSAYMSNPVDALESLLRSIGVPTESTKQRVYEGCTFTGPPHAQFMALRTLIDGFILNAAGKRDEAKLRHQFEEFHLRLRDLRDLLLGLVGALDAEEP